MSQMQKRHAEARERTRKTGLDWYHWRRKFDSRFGRRYRRATEDTCFNTLWTDIISPKTLILYLNMRLT